MMDGFFIGQYKPSELAKDYHKQGRENPSYEAYQSLYKELLHYVNANDCTLECKIYKKGILLAENYSCCYDYSEYCDLDFEDHALMLFKDYGLELVNETMNEAKTMLAELCDCSRG